MMSGLCATGEDNNRTAQVSIPYVNEVNKVDSREVSGVLTKALDVPRGQVLLVGFQIQVLHGSWLPLLKARSTN